jgi:uncharacterized protein YqjF (DUF2071 family)
MPEPVTPVRRPVMRHRWETATFLHWSFDPGVVQRLLPRGLTVQPWDGRAWVGLVPFHMRVRPGVGPLPAVPRLAVFPETNVRTYVVGPDGEPGVWFFSLDAAGLAAVLTARAGWGLPYYWSRLRIARSGDAIRYSGRRRWPRDDAGGREVGYDVRVRVGEELAPSKVTAFDHFLTARFSLWSTYFGALWRSRANHPPWRLNVATLESCEQNLLSAAGLPEPEGWPLVHFAPGVDVRIGMPRRIARR